MSEHTKGPWIWVDTPAIRKLFNGCSVVAAEHIDDAIIATIAEDVYGHESNAQLIAAAPELLEALKAFLTNSEIGEAESQRLGLPRLIEVRNKAIAAIRQSRRPRPQVNYPTPKMEEER